MRKYLSGESTNPPDWIILLEAANFDPLRAQVLEDEIGAEWFFRYTTYRREKARADAQREKRMRNTVAE